MFHVIFKEEIVSKVFSECFKGFSRKFQETFKVFQKSFMFYGTHRSFPSRRKACLQENKSGPNCSKNEISITKTSWS